MEASRAPPLLTIFALAAFYATPAQGIHFDLPGRTQKCLGEEVEKGDLIIATYKSQEGRILTVTVTDHVGQQIYQKTVKGGKYTVTASANGAQRTCFFNTEAMPTVVDFDIKRGLEAKDYGNIADKNSLKPLELELLRLEDIIKYIQTEFQRMEANEQEQTNINNSTNSMVFWFSIFSMFCIVGINAAQIYFLVQYFRDKRFKDM
uniref:GOLD domain-containing protein n=1 Tax=Lotharella oceanica TaxID=641309 RepID=A0A7S2TF84_9EUKA